MRLAFSVSRRLLTTPHRNSLSREFSQIVKVAHNAEGTKKSAIMARLASFLALCLTAPFIISGGNAMSLEELGMYYAASAYDYVCWWEDLKQIPTNSKAFNGCTGQAMFQKNFVMTDSFFKQYPDQRQQTFADGVRDNCLQGQIADDYKQKCEKYLNDREAAPPADESDVMNDGGQTYPFKAFTYCLMHTLRERKGDQAIEDVKNEKTHSRQHWTTILLEQQNKLRALHGVEPLKPMKSLMEGAQAWAEVNANECNMYHSKGENRLYRGNSTGENLSAGTGDEAEIAAYQAADGWYEEIKDYPWSTGGYKGGKALFEKIGHFTQSVWKESMYVGYGYAYNKDCADGSYNRYVAARYYPAGNMDGEYQKNVLPPK